MKRFVIAIMLAMSVSSVTAVSAGTAAAAVQPGLYRLCPVDTNIPGAFRCRNITMRQYIAEVRRPQALGIGYGPLISTPYGGYMKLHAFGRTDLSRLVFRRNATGYDVYTESVDKTFYGKLRMTRLR